MLKFISVIKGLTNLAFKAKNMTTFVSRVSPTTGKAEWVPQSEDYDYHQEIARSAYADMLHDTERNQKYHAALRAAIRLKQGQGEPAHVLDIGTGTGLLSMMAVNCGADSVTACEAFKPMADCAKQVIHDNGMSSKINLVPKRSTEVKVGPGCDMEHRANILVTEVFDTELIGEGAIPTFHHAHKELLEKDSIVVPSAANMFVQVVDSDFVGRWIKFQPIKLGEDDTITVPKEVSDCHGAAAVHDLQMEQLKDEQFTALSEIVQIFRFDYSGKSSIDFKGFASKVVSAQRAGTVTAVLMWWDLEMDTEGKILLSCAPRWGHPEPHALQWRDHWMQAVYYPAHQIQVENGEQFVVQSSHDEYSLWFDVVKANSNNNNVIPEAPVCRCGAHVACSRTRLGMLNDPVRNNKYYSALSKVMQKESVCLCLSDTSLLPLIAAKAGAEKVFTLEQHSMGQKLVQSYIKQNSLEGRIRVIGKRPDEVTQVDLENLKPNVILSEPYFSCQTLPWHSLYFWYARTYLSKLVGPPGGKPRVLPYAASMKAVAVEFDDLWKIKSSVGNCEGLDLSHFDKIIEESSDVSDYYMEPHPLWEYPSVPVSDQFSLMTFDFTRPLSGIRTIKREGFEEIWCDGNCNGVAVWLDYHLDANTVINSGLLCSPKIDQSLEWDPYTRQGVHLFKRPYPVSTDSPQKRWRVQYKVVFKPATGEFDFHFDVTAKMTKTERVV